MLKLTKKYWMLSIVIIFLITIAIVFNSSYTQAQGDYESGSLLKSNTSSAVYYIGKDNEKYVFTDERTYYSWYDNFDNVIETDVQELDKHEDGGAVTIRPGTKLITHVDTAKVYAVEPNGVLRHIPDEQTASALYGNNWKSLVVDIPTILFTTTYTKGDDLSNALPTGTIVKQQGTNAYYYIKNGERRPFISSEAFENNKLKFSNAIEADISNYKSGESIQEKEDELVGYAEVKETVVENIIDCGIANTPIFLTENGTTTVEVDESAIVAWECFTDKIEKCVPAKIISILPGQTIGYNIIGKVGNVCKISGPSLDLQTGESEIIICDFSDKLIQYSFEQSEISYPGIDFIKGYNAMGYITAGCEGGDNNTEDECSTDLDCDDGNECTVDSCAGTPKRCFYEIDMECMGRW